MKTKFIVTVESSDDLVYHKDIHNSLVKTMRELVVLINNLENFDKCGIKIKMKSVIKDV